MGCSVASLLPRALEAPDYDWSWCALNEAGEFILKCLNEVAAERRRRADDLALGERVGAIKQFQHARFARTYADLLADPRYGDAARFFLADLYGPEDYSERDVQFARVVPALLKLFPREIISTVSDLAALHALSERLDTAMALVVADGRVNGQVNGQDYARAWRVVGEPLSRERQVALMVSIGTALDRHTRNMLMRHSLRLMRAPAHAAGLAALQRFLETGFDTFRTLRGAEDFLAIIAQRERALSIRLFEGGDVPGDVLV